MCVRSCVRVCLCLCYIFALLWTRSCGQYVAHVIRTQQSTCTHTHMCVCMHKCACVFLSVSEWVTSNRRQYSLSFSFCSSVYDFTLYCVRCWHQKHTKLNRVNFVTLNFSLLLAPCVVAVAQRVHACAYVCVCNIYSANWNEGSFVFSFRCRFLSRLYNENMCAIYIHKAHIGASHVWSSDCRSVGRSVDWWRTYTHGSICTVGKNNTHTHTLAHSIEHYARLRSIHPSEKKTTQRCKHMVNDTLHLWQSADVCRSLSLSVCVCTYKNPIDWL